MEPNHTKSSDSYAADISSIREAQVRIKPFAQQTPVLTSDTLDSIAGRKLYFKCECFQKGGAFKFRGACNAIFSLDDDQATKGVVTHSSGNHAAALSLAAKLRGVPAYIVIPKDAPKCKVANVKRYGGQVIFSEPSMQYQPQLLVWNEGGGLISGVALAAKSINPAIHIFAAEPRMMLSSRRSMAGSLCYPRSTLLPMGFEPFLETSCGKIGLAAVLSNSFKTNPAYSECNNIGIVISGGNIDLGVLWNSVNE
ncbi:hypothetical protein EJD97_001888 [Solanum chilense]|uniref:Tryptophan synthase beta chain-like PALP domain-containing protein n=1 Tax=Solanum chilense TaxID=4083 RepID=A0A6N2ANR8_SOLCI|nr:hypothetical protein EJD97_001888 [Solanum chilense]